MQHLVRCLRLSLALLEEPTRQNIEDTIGDLGRSLAFPNDAGRVNELANQIDQKWPPRQIADLYGRTACDILVKACQELKRHLEFCVKYDAPVDIDELKAAYPINEIANEVDAEIGILSALKNTTTREDIATKYFDLEQEHGRGRGTKEPRFKALEPMFKEAGIEHSISNLDSITKQFPRTKLG